MTQTLYLIRHASASAQDNRRRCISQTDLPLNASGIFQAQQLARWLGMRSVRALYASRFFVPDKRQIFYPAARFPSSSTSGSPKCASAHGKTFPLMKYGCATPTCTPFAASIWARPRPPGGESFVEAGRRLNAFLRSLPEDAGDMAVVTHGGILRGWLCGAMSVSPDDILSIRQPWSGVTVVQRESNRFSVSSVGCMPVPRSIRRGNRIVLRL